MTRLIVKTLVVALAGLLLALDPSAGQVAAAPPEKGTKPAYKATPAELAKYEATARKVFDDLLAHLTPEEKAGLHPDLAWPPEFEVAETTMTNSGPTYYNATAFLKHDGEKFVRKDGKVVPGVVITRGYLDRFDGDVHALALVLGHELGHHMLGHTAQRVTTKPAAKAAMDGHRQEADADLFGARLMLRAGYSIRQAVAAKWKGMARAGGLYSPANGTCLSHPATSDRAARLTALLDAPAAPLWRNMAAFENGVTFLAVEDYAAAELCFERVAREFPNCYEAWANLGYARLMRYCGTLSPAALRELGVGHLVGTGAYQTAGSLVRSSTTKLWEQAKADLERAVRLNPQAAPALASLGLLHLVHPAGKAAGVGEAERYLAAAVAALDVEAGLDGSTRLTLLVNLGAARIAAGNPAEGRRLLDQARELARKVYPTADYWPDEFASALAFNTAVAMTAEGEVATAARLFETYLQHTAPTNRWWTVAYTRYADLCRELGKTARPREELAGRTPLRLRLTVTVAAGTVHLGQPLAEAIGVLGTPTRVTAEKGASDIRRLRFERHGIELVADDDEVYAVIVIAENGPGVPVCEVGPDGRRLGTLRVGMTREQVHEVLLKRKVLYRSLTMLGKAPRQEYEYYPELGVAVKYDGDGPDAAVVEVVVAQMGNKDDKGVVTN
jgi:tetratricopeptide (TPR) repeat protein